MTTASEIALQAFREGNIAGSAAPLTQVQIDEAITALNDFIETLYGFEMGEHLVDWPVAPRNNAPVQSRFPLYPADQALPAGVYPYPPPNVRLLINVTAAFTVWFPPQPADGARIEVVNMGSPEVDVTLQGNGRLIDGTTSVTELPSVLAGRRYLYRADLGDWRQVAALAAEDNSPLPRRFDTLLALGVLDRIAPRYGRTLNPAQEAMMRRMLTQMKSQYRQPTPTPYDASGGFLIPSADPSRGAYGYRSDLLR